MNLLVKVGGIVKTIWTWENLSFYFMQEPCDTSALVFFNENSYTVPLNKEYQSQDS